MTSPELEPVPLGHISAHIATASIKEMVIIDLFVEGDTPSPLDLTLAERAVTSMTEALMAAKALEQAQAEEPTRWFDRVKSFYGKIALECSREDVRLLEELGVTVIDWLSKDTKPEGNKPPPLKYFGHTDRLVEDIVTTL